MNAGFSRAKTMYDAMQAACNEGGEGDWSPLGGTMDKTFIDTEPEVCEAAVSYRVRAARGNLFSEWCQPINFDLSAGPGVTSNVAGFVGGGDGVTADGA